MRSFVGVCFFCVFTVAVAVAFAGSGAKAAPFWVGMSPAQGQAQNVSLFELDVNANVVQVLTYVQLQKDKTEHVNVDAFRCLPGGTFCTFLTTNDAGTKSWLYNVTVSQTSGKSGLAHVTELDGKAVNLHAELFSGSAITVLQKPGDVKVVRVNGNGVESLVDISSYVGANGKIKPGYTTQCSDVDAMWVYIEKGEGVGSDIIVQLDLLKTRVVDTTHVLDVKMVSMWASCIDSTNVNKLGGTAMVNNGTTLSYGTFNEGGHFVVSSTGKFPSHGKGMTMTALLTEPIKYDYVFGVYPSSVTPGSSDPQDGVLGFGFFRLFHTFTFVNVPFYLVGAGRIY
eukprot:m.22741 g.22741  ORF g.22741 m.22741 type:complete len:340 (-) comp8890_c0_seq1:176-1195(-)